MKINFLLFLLLFLSLFLFLKYIFTFKKIIKYKPIDLNLNTISTIEKPIEKPIEKSIEKNNSEKKIKINPETLTLTNKIIFYFKLKENNIYEFVNYFLNNFNNKNLFIDCLYFLFQNFDFKDIFKKLEISQFIINNSTNNYQINDIYNEIISISSNKLYNVNIRANAIDILKRSNNKYYLDISNSLLNDLRQYERNIITYRNINQIRNILNERKNLIIPINHINDEETYNFQLALLNDIQRLENVENNLFRNNNKKETIYNDSQNVHNNTINESVKLATNNLCNNINSNSNINNIETELQKYYPKYKENEIKIKKSLEKINTDKSKFNNNITVKDILNNIFYYISNSNYKNEMINILGDELTDMSESCLTGHVSRLINSIQGFPDIPENLKIKINPKDEIYANIQTYLNNEIQKDINIEEHLDNMVSDDPKNKEKYYDFISEKMKIKYKSLQNEYNQIIDNTLLELNIEDSIKNYIKDDIGVKYIINKIKI